MALAILRFTVGDRNPCTRRSPFEKFFLFKCIHDDQCSSGLMLAKIISLQFQKLDATIKRGELEKPLICNTNTPSYQTYFATCAPFSLPAQGISPLTVGKTTNIFTRLRPQGKNSIFPQLA